MSRTDVCIGLCVDRWHDFHGSHNLIMSDVTQPVPEPEAAYQHGGIKTSASRRCKSVLFTVASAVHAVYLTSMTNQ